MDLTCPHCATRYEVALPVLPAKVRCTTCGVKCLVDETGGISVMEESAPVSMPAVHAAAKPAKRSAGGNPAMISALVVMALAGAAFLVLRNEEKPVTAVGNPEPAPVPPTAQVEERPSVEVPATLPPVAKAPSPVVAAEPEKAVPEKPPEKIVPTVSPKPASLSGADPEIARVLAAMDGRISANPATSEKEVRSFIRAFYTSRNGATIGGRLTEAHPELALSLLGDLWKRIEDSPGAKLPVSPPLLIGAMRSRAQDMTEAYAGLLGEAAEKGPVDDEGIRKLSQDPQIAKLLGHFAKGQDSGTPDNALTLGRMIHDIRRGGARLADAGPKPEPRSIDDLPKVARSVDLGGFESVQDLVKWAHGIMLSKEETMSISEGEEATQMRRRAKAYIDLPREVLLPHPSAEDFPGKVSARAPRIEKEVTIDTAIANWHPTGLYAAPGEVITVRVPAGLRAKGYKLVIGTNSDDLTGGQYDDGRKKLKRFPLIIQRTSLDESRVEVGNPFGGPIFIDVPYRNDEGVIRIPAHGETVRGYPKAPAPDLQKVTIGGAVEMPWWRPGMTDDEWRKQLTKPGPWAELDFGMLRMSVPTEDAKGIRDIAKLTEFWGLVMAAQWKFGGFPGVRVIPMRVNWDRQISAGFMHSGYPIGAPLSAVRDGIDVAKIRMTGTWGLFHEIGHNHQPVCITPEGYGETTVNLFSLASQAAILPNKEPTLGHPALADPKELLRRKRAGENDAWVNLAVFLPLIKEFGFESLTKTMQVYWKEDPAADGGVKNIDALAREDLWARRYGDTVKRDLGPYFEGVGYRLSAATKAQLSKYEKWLP